VIGGHRDAGGGRGWHDRDKALFLARLKATSAPSPYGTPGRRYKNQYAPATSAVSAPLNILNSIRKGQHCYP
jgi:hypothetical protein